MFKVSTNSLASKVVKDMKDKISKIEVGFFEDETTYAGGKGKRRLGKITSRRRGKPNKIGSAELAEILDEKYGFMTKPVKEDTKDKKAFIDLVVNDMINKANKKAINNDNRIKNGLLALFLKPIYRDKYGLNNVKTAKRKGFNKLLVDTGDTLKRIGVRYKGSKGVIDND